MTKNNRLLNFFLIPTMFGIVSLIISFVVAQITVKLVFLIPHFSSVKEGSLSILLSMLMGFPLGVLVYFLLFYINSIKKRLAILIGVIVLLFPLLTLSDLVNGSCISFKSQKNEVSIDLILNDPKFKIWNCICFY